MILILFLVAIVEESEISKTEVSLSWETALAHVLFTCASFTFTNKRRITMSAGNEEKKEKKQDERNKN